MREYLEKGWKEAMDNRATIKLAVETLLEVVESSKNIEICVIYPGNKNEMLSDE